ncbi:MAG TPA: universal stress protein [Acidobacteriaceae bacterium]
MTLRQNEISRSLIAPAKIVVATDLTDTDYLLPHAVAQAKAGGASIILVHAVLPHESVPMESGPIPYYDPLRLDRDARLMLENLARDVRDQGVECATAVRHGFVPDVVTEVVSNAGAGRLIIGTHGRRGLKKFVLGSIARQLLEIVDVPVCTVGPRAHKGVTALPGAILHPVSLAGLHEASAALTFGLSRQFRSQVLLLHVVAPTPPVARDPAGAVTTATDQLQRLIPPGLEAGTQVRVRIAVGSVVSEILSVAEEAGAGLIVLGVHASVHSWLPGTEPAAYKILVSAPCPVLSLRVSPGLLDVRAGDKEEKTPVIIG